MKNIQKICILGFGIAVVMLYLFVQENISKHLMINEIAFSQENGIDWIEIYNPTLNNLSLEGLYLSDDEDDFFKFKIEEEIIVPSKGFAVIYCKEYEGDLTNSTVTNFRIADDETVYLATKEGTAIDWLSAIVPEQDITEFSVGRFPDGGDETFIMSNYTPGESNKKDYE